MPGDLVHDGEFQGEVIQVGSRFSSLGVHGGQLLGGGTHRPVDVQNIRGILAGVSLGEGGQGFLGVLAVDLADDCLHFRLGKGGFVKHGRGEGKFAEDGANHQGNLPGVLPHAVLQGIAQEPVVDLGTVAHISAGHRHSGHDLGVGLHQLGIGKGLQLGCISSGETQLRKHGLHDLFAGSHTGGQHGFVGHTAHNEATVEQAVGCGNLHQVCHLHAAAGLAEDGHILRVAAEEGDVVMHPLQCRHHICVACVAGVFILLAEGG